MAKSAISKQQAEDLKKKQLSNDGVNRLFKIVNEGINEDNRAEYELLRRSKVTLGDVLDLSSGLLMRKDTLINQLTKETTILEYILDIIATPEQIEKATKRYEENYKKFNDILEEEAKKAEAAEAEKKAKKD